MVQEHRSADEALKYGRQGNLMKWREMLNADCPKRDARLSERCDLICPDLPKVL